jgi:hypothetical protein
MASPKNQSDDAKMNKIHDAVSENYTKLSEEYAKSQQQYLKAISGLQQECLDSFKIAIKTTISVQKDYLSNYNPRYPSGEMSSTRVDDVINKSNNYTTNIIRWIDLQNQLAARNAEVLKGYVKSYNSAILTMAEYQSNFIKAMALFGSKT